MRNLFDDPRLMAPEGLGSGVEDSGSAPPPPSDDDGGREPSRDPIDQGDGRGEVGDRARPSIRRTLERTIGDLSTDASKGGRDDRGRFVKPPPEETDGAGTRGQRQEAPAPGGTPAEAPASPAGAPKVDPPAGWPKEAKDAWAGLPEPVRQATVRREQQMAAGVEQLRQRHAMELEAHKQLGDAVRPYIEDIKRAGVDPHTGIQRLLQWHRDMQSNPRQTLVRLAAQLGVDPRQPLVGGAPQQQQAAQAPYGQQTIPDEIRPLIDAISPYFQQQYQPVNEQVNQLNQRLASFEQYETHRQQQEAQRAQQATENQVARWSENKEYFPHVRSLMREVLIGADQNGTASRFLDRFGEVDLDKLYNEVVWQHPEIRDRLVEAQRQDEVKRLQAEQAAKAAEEKRVQDQRRADADRARRAATSVRPGAPGPAPQRRPGEQRKATSVRDSIMAAMAQVNENSGSRI